MKVAELNNGQTVWTEQFTNFDPVTFMAVWHILGLNIGGSSKKAAGISPDGTTIVFGTDCEFVKAWVNNQNIRNILHFSDMSNLSDVSFDIDVRLSRSNEPTNTQPVLLGGSYQSRGPRLVGWRSHGMDAPDSDGPFGDAHCHER